MAPFSALVLRLSMTVFLGTSAWRHLAREGALSRTLSGVEIILAAALFVGAFTQAAALVTAILCAALLVFPRLRAAPRSTVAFALVISLSLLVTGAGAIAFDLPL